MIQTDPFPQLSYYELIKRLSAGEAVAATVVTPNRRLARALKDSLNTYQLSSLQKAAWPSADILPFVSFVECVYQAAWYSADVPDLPLLLTDMQAYALWHDVVRSSEAGQGLLNVVQAARLSYEAWQHVHVWRLATDLKKSYLNDDCRVFQRWMTDYGAILTRNQQIDLVCLTDFVIDLYAQMLLRPPNILYCYGFERFTPQQMGFLSTLQVMGCDIHCVSPPYFVQSSSKNTSQQRLECVNSEEEIYQAAHWARTRLEADSNASIGVVVPTLSQLRNKVQQIFYEVMRPDVRDALPQSHTVQMHVPFNISLGQPLTAYPLVDTALSILMLIRQAMTFDRISDLLRSPFLGGGESEISERALLSRYIRPFAEPKMTLEQLLWLMRRVDDESVGGGRTAKCPILANNLSSLLTFCRSQVPREDRHANYAQLLIQILEIMGFPGDRTLDSTEYQTLQKWYAVIADFAALDRVIDTTCYTDALSRLYRTASNTIFQPQTPSVPIQILGVLEAAGLVFDHLWVMGLSEEQWPLRPNPNPFLPNELQKNTYMPFGSVNETLRYSQQLKNNWLISAQEVILSHPGFTDDKDVRAVAPSPMIHAIPESIVDLPRYRRHRDLIAEAASLEHILDDQVESLTRGQQDQGISGGVAIIKDYAACPFRAWARHRINVVDSGKPHTGLDARERGMLVHRVLCLIWRRLETKTALDSIVPADLDNQLNHAVSQAISEMKQWRPFSLSGRFAAIEHQRLFHLLHEWLEMEKQRDAFDVVATEAKTTVRIGNFVLKVRLDRIDRLENGQQLIMDYKTRPYPASTLLGERPDEPQLPLYLVMTEFDAAAVAGIAFASVHPIQMCFSGITREENLLPGVKAFDAVSADTGSLTWEALISKWQTDLTHLADDFVNGNASVLPKNYPQTCQYCDMQSLCRIHERIGRSVNDREGGNGNTI